MPIITMYFCGTFQSGKEEHNETVSSLKRDEVQQPSTPQSPLMPGPGSQSYTNTWRPQPINILTSLFESATGWSIWFNSDTRGMSTNVKDAIADIRKKILLTQPSEEVTIALIGWSRGAVTAIKTANAIQREIDNRIIRSVNVHIFALDPVPGPGNFSANVCHLPACVTAYHGLYAMFDTQLLFGSVIPSPSPTANTKMHLYKVPANHETIVGLKSADHLALLSQILRGSLTPQDATGIHKNVADICKNYIRSQLIKLEMKFLTPNTTTPTTPTDDQCQGIRFSNPLPGSWPLSRVIQAVEWTRLNQIIRFYSAGFVHPSLDRKIYDNRKHYSLTRFIPTRMDRLSKISDIEDIKTLIQQS